MGATHVVVVIATFRRPERLDRALASLVRSAGGLPPGWRAGVVVVDDDADGSAGPVAAAHDAALDLGVRYVPCGSRNISLARNAGLEAALPDADWVGSIDDDVVVPEDWFAVCARAVTGGGHDAVTGPLLKDFSHGPAWLDREPFGELGLLAGTDGEDAFVCATGNNWVSADFLRGHPDLRFSEDLGRSGGEDMEFFYRAVGAGLRPVYSRGAAVTETEPPARCTLRYQVRRAYWLGISEAQISLRLGLATRLRLLARAARRTVERGTRQLPAERRGDVGPRWTLAVLAQGAGTALGCAGVTMGHK